MSLDSDPPDLPAPLTEAVVAGAVAAHAAEPHDHSHPTHTHCENCGTALNGPYCHRCGQHDFEFHRSFWHVFLEVLENFFHFDAKLFRNTLTLLFRPGRLTADFNAGKRAAQMPPFRLYLFVSVLFFFLLFLEESSPSQPVGDHLNLAVGSTVNGQPVSIPEALHSATQSAAADPADASPPPKTAKPERNVDKLRNFAEHLQTEVAAERKSAHKTKEERDAARWLTELAHRASDPAHRQEMVEHFLHSIPKMLLLCLPLFALYTRVLFRKSGQVYLQHLVLALHFHTFIYLWLMTRNGWVFLVGLPGWGLAPVLQFFCGLWLWIYPFVMLRHLFGNSWRRTCVKTFLLFAAYTLTLGVVMLLTAVAIFLLL